ncbi:restriction endonuclease subunit S [Lacticaseibacillus rhamnosus]|uniref:restriction endonuclease subunit S n=1 Tax=Lacticaseibacillus rhamnosus TaxID=47715 RepID=UPI0007DED2CB|nr:restriction endonuclease subunit S [Lacticaseibacillus rhamnosus]OAU18331.1 restriction endonuclease subunit S [Lacticaseibacillus rhamnosus]
MSKGTRNVPALRFKGFSDAWEKRKLGEISDIRGGGTPSTSKPEYWDGEIDWYAPAEIGTQRYVSGSRRQITNLGLNKSSATMLPANKTILFTSRAGIGNAAILTKSGATNQGFQSIVVEPATDVYFLYSEIPEIKRKAIRLAAGSTFLEISGKSLSKIQIWLPSFKEQSRIGHLFLQIDNLIAATQGKLDNLEKIKRALLKHLFDQSMRFRGYSDPWEKRKFGELYKPNKERNESAEFSSENTLSIATMTVNRKGNGAAKTSLLKYKVIRIGDIAFEGHTSKKFAFGRFVLNDVADGIMSPRFTCLRPIHRQIIQFWKQYIHYEPILRPILIRSTKLGTMMNELVVPDLLKQNIRVPSINEQKLIGKSLSRVDDLIAATQSKLSSLETLKKALLQGLFI